MDILEGILTGAAKEILGTYHVQWLGHDIDLTPSWQRVTMADAVKNVTGADFMACIGDADKGVELAKSVGVDMDGVAHTWGNALYETFDQKVEETLIQPTFITMYPVEVSPLAKRSPEQPALTERYEMFICGCEMGNAFSELNDPIDQYERFKAQAAKPAHRRPGLRHRPLRHDALRHRLHPRRDPVPDNEDPGQLKWLRTPLRQSGAGVFFLSPTCQMPHRIVYLAHNIPARCVQ